MHSIIISTNGIDILLSNLNVYKATGPDGISARILKEMHSKIAPILKIIFDCSFDTGIVLNDWKTANVTPIFQKGDRLKSVNYWPISLTIVSSQKSLNIFCPISWNILNGILHPNQHGFQHSHSCETQLISLVHDLTFNYDINLQISMDMAKVFDTIPHQRLLYKLHWYGVQGKVHKWISEFLANILRKLSWMAHALLPW